MDEARIGIGARRITEGAIRRRNQRTEQINLSRHEQFSDVASRRSFARSVRGCVEHADSAAEAAELGQTLIGVAIERSCEGSGNAAAAEGAGMHTYTSSTARRIGESQLRTFLLSCIHLCAANRECNVPKDDFFGSCGGGPPNRTMRPGAFQ